MEFMSGFFCLLNKVFVMLLCRIILQKLIGNLYVDTQLRFVRYFNMLPGRSMNDKS
jgi:hypothetical protein